MIRMSRFSIVVTAIVACCLAMSDVSKAQTAHAILLRIGIGGGVARTANSAPSTAASQGYLGIVFHDVGDDRLSALNLKEPHGVEILHVDHDGPANQAGLREHDVILQMNGQVIEGEEQLRRILRETPVGRTVTLVLSRDGQTLTVSTQLADRARVEHDAWQQHIVPDSTPPSPLHGNSFLGGGTIASPAITAPPDARSHPFMGTVILGSSYTGAAMEMIGPQLAQFFGSQGGNGLLVRSVDPNSPAAAAGLRAGDVVVRANAVIIVGTGDWARVVRENRGHPLSVVVVRDRQELTFVLIPDSKKRTSLDFQRYPLPGEAIPAEDRNQALAQKHSLDPID